MALFQIKRRNILPGFGLSMGYTVFYLSAIVIVPLSMIFFNTIPMGWEPFVNAVTAPRVLASYKLSFSTAFFAALFDAFAGLLTLHQKQSVVLHFRECSEARAPGLPCYCGYSVQDLPLLPEP